MIDEYWTWVFYGYHSAELKHHSAKPIVARCNGCCKYRVLRMCEYNDLCRSCAGVGRYHSEETRHKMSESRRHQIITDETKCKISASNTGKTRSKEDKLRRSEFSKGKNNPNYGKRCSEETKQRMSATKQGISYEEWDGFSVEREYCYKFDNGCRERNREKYDRRCFVCGMTEEDNGQKLSVHHVDMNKLQGCDDHAWKLVPLCKSCHNGAHTPTRLARIEYVLCDIVTA